MVKSNYMYTIFVYNDSNIHIIMIKKAEKHQTSASVVNKIIGLNAGYGFKPNREFYDSILINQKRFGMITSGKTSPTFHELESICKYFNTELKNYL